MDTLNRIQEDVKVALKAKDSRKAIILRMILANVKNLEIEKGESLKEGDVIQILKSEVKRVKDAISQFKAAGRTDLVEKESGDLGILEVYLPQMLSEDETRELVNAAITQTSAVGMKDMGKVMGAIMAKNKDNVDGGIVNKIVREELAKL